MKNTFIYIFIVSLLVVTGYSAWQVYFRTYIQNDTVNIHKLPRIIGDWESRELIITEEEYALLETRNAFVREYTHAKSGNKVYLFIVYSENNRKVSHPPEICYTGNGYSVVSSGLKEMPDIKTLNQQVLRVNKLLLEKGHFEQIAYYWFKVADQFTSNYWKQQMLIALKSFLRKPASSALIRISSDVSERNYVKTEEVVEEFTREIVPYLFEYLPD